MMHRSAESKLGVIRFYTVHDAMSIGYAQRLKVIMKGEPTFEVFRRPTGGSHVEVDYSTLMYAFAAPRDGRFQNYKSMRLYFDERIAKGLSDLGISSVVANIETATIDIEGKVIGGDSMLWGKKGALLQGLLVIDPYDVEKIKARMPLKSRIIDGEVYREFDALKNLPAISTRLNGNQKQDAKELVADSILQRLTGGSYEEVKINGEILNEARKFVDKRYGRRSWLEKHEPTFTKDEIEESPGEELEGPLKTLDGYCFYVLVEDADFKRMAEKNEKEC
jgi:lipoate-protein ligase A